MENTKLLEVADRHHHTRNGGLLLQGNCLDLLPHVPSNSVDLILCDLPYGVTQNKLDIIIDPKKLWPEYWRVAKKNAAVVLFGQDKFTAQMMLSDKNHRYNLIWDKRLPSGFLNANRMPLRSHEDIMVFYRKPCVYNPQKVKGAKNHSKGVPKQTQNNNYGDFAFVDNMEELGDMKHPRSILQFDKVHPSVAKHRTEKPVPLLKWIISTYTNEGALILDNAMGSGSMCEAADELGRYFIGMDNDPESFDTAKGRFTN